MSDVGVVTSRRRPSPRRVLGAIGWYVGMVLLTVAIVGPVAYVGLSAFKPSSQIGGQPSLLPRSWTIENFANLFEVTPMATMMLNTLIVSLATVAISVSTACGAAYAIARMEFAGRLNLLRAVLIGYMFPSVLIVVPMYVQMTNLGLTDSLLGLTLAFTSIALPFSIWMMISFFQGLPREIEEAAALDGCGVFQTFLRVVLPLSKPGIAATSAAAFMLAWGEYIFAITLVSTDDQRTVVAGLNALIGNVGLDYGLMFAGSMVALSVPLVVFLVFQKWIVSGMSAGAIKG